jgi:glycosyltransferase involved in cell wall biosynthesis
MNSDVVLPILAPPRRGPIETCTSAPTFSVLIPAYQSAATIGASIRSALTQTYPPHEIIVVDDGSSDDLDAALREFRGQITLVTKANGGAASARNAGLAKASGEFLAILDSDDTYHPRRLEALAGLALSRPDLDLITTDAFFVVRGNNAGRFHVANPFPIRNQRQAILKSCFVGGWPAVRLARLRRIGGFDESLRTGSDWDCWLRLILDGAGAGLVDEPYYNYVVRAGSLTSNRVSTLWDRVRLLEKAARNPALQPNDRPVLSRSIRAHRGRAFLAEAEVEPGNTRGRLLRHSISRDLRSPARVAILLAAIHPPLAGFVTSKGSPSERRFVGRER